MGSLAEGVDLKLQTEWLAERHVHRQEPCRTCWARYLCGGGCHHEVIRRGRPACDYIRGWLHYCIEAYVRLSGSKQAPSLVELIISGQHLRNRCRTCRSTFAARMAQLGHSVCLVERARFPRSHLGESLSLGVSPLLETIGAREAVEAAGFLRVRSVRVKWDAALQVRKTRASKACWSIAVNSTGS